MLHQLHQGKAVCKIRWPMKWCPSRFQRAVNVIKENKDIDSNSGNCWHGCSSNYRYTTNRSFVFNIEWVMNTLGLVVQFSRNPTKTAQVLFETTLLLRWPPYTLCNMSACVWYCCWAILQRKVKQPSLRPPSTWSACSSNSSLGWNNTCRPYWLGGSSSWHNKSPNTQICNLKAGLWNDLILKAATRNALLFEKGNGALNCFAFDYCLTVRKEG